MKMNGLLTSVLVVIGIAIGFLVGRSTGESGTVAEYKSTSTSTEGRDGGPAKSDRYASRTVGRSGERDEGGGRRSAAATIREAARKLELSAMPQMDFDAMFEVYGAVRWMTPDDVQAALAELESMKSDPQIKMQLAMMLISQWAKQDGRGAVEYALQQEQAMERTMGVMGGMMGWLKDDPEGAYAWYQENREKVSKAGGMAGQMDGLILAALAHDNMDQAFEGLANLSNHQQTMAIAMMSSQMTMDPVKREQFIQRLERIEDETMRKQGLQSMLSVWVIQDPKAAVEFIDSREWQGNLHAELRDSVAASWSMVDAQASLEWRLDNVGENEDRGGVVASGFAQWMAQDPDSAQEWLKAQPEEVLSDALYQQTANHLQMRSDYAEAAEWAIRIEEQGTREATLQGIYQTWSATDETAAREWVGGLDEATRAAVETAPEVAPGTPLGTGFVPAPQERP